MNGNIASTTALLSWFASTVPEGTNVLTAEVDMNPGFTGGPPRIRFQVFANSDRGAKARALAEAWDLQQLPTEELGGALFLQWSLLGTWFGVTAEIVVTTYVKLPAGAFYHSLPD